MAPLFDIHSIASALRKHTPDTTPSARTRHQAAVALVLHQTAQDSLQALLIKRAEDHRDPWSGQMALPGGWKDPGDAALDHTARRETREEIGLHLDDTRPLGRLDDLDTERLRSIGLSVASFVYYAASLPPLHPNNEVAAIVHVPLENFLNPGCQLPYYFPLDPVQRPFPSVHHNGHIIWGLTYRIFQNLFGLLGHQLPDERDPQSTLPPAPTE